MSAAQWTVVALTCLVAGLSIGFALARRKYRGTSNLVRDPRNEDAQKARMRGGKPPTQ